MKRLTIAMVASLVAFMAIALTACQDELYDNPANRPEKLTAQSVYFKGGDKVQSFFVEGEDVTVNNVRVALTQLPTEEVKVNLEIGDEAQLEAYNKANGTSYKVLPKEMYAIANEVTFAKGEALKTLNISIKNLKFDPAYTYALPMRIASSAVNIINAEKQMLLVLEQRITTKALWINGSGSEDDKMFPNDFKVDTWTLEVMINREHYSQNNRSICGTKLVQGSSMNDEIYIRFGDVTIQPNQLQIKTANSQIDIPKSGLEAKPGEWYMLGFRYDGKKNAVFVNGKKVIEREMRTGPYGLIGFWIGGNNELIREVRFWKTARTDKEINDNTWKMVDASDDNLLLYYPLNGKKRDVTTGEVTEDATKLWDWSKSQKHLSMPSGAEFVDNNGEPFIFPLP